jgi:hypothetical protein
MDIQDELVWLHPDMKSWALLWNREGKVLEHSLSVPLPHYMHTGLQRGWGDCVLGPVYSYPGTRWQEVSLEFDAFVLFGFLSME